MKKSLLLMAFMASFLFGRSQTVLNEIYTEPNGSTHEFFELYNSGGGAQSVDCFTLLVYWQTSATVRGWYVLDLPNLAVASKSFLVGAAASPFNVQSLTNVSPNFNWNDVNFRNGTTGGYLKKFQLNATNTGYNDVSGTIPATLNDLFSDVSLGGGHNYLQIVYVNGALPNVFWGGGSSATLPTEITTMAGLPVDMAGICTDFTATFGSLSAENVNQSPGSDNGFAREFDGKCGAWDKTSAGLQHTPGSANGGAVGETGDLTTAQFITCHTAPGQSTVNYSITGVVSPATQADDFPVDVLLYYDNGTTIGQLDGLDVFVGMQTDLLISDPAKSFQIIQNQSVLVIYRTKRGCFDKLVRLANGCIVLPVTFKSFTANRTSSTIVSVRWETASEVNSAGFAIERNLNGNWEQVGYVPSSAAGGASTGTLSYSFIDNNSTRGITQYRIRQVDIDNKSTYSEIRSVRGDGQPVKMTVYPNPSIDGKVNIMFDDNNQTRDVSVSDMTGRTVRQLRGIRNNNVTIENLHPGVYTIRVLAVETGEQAVEKLIVNKR